MQKRRTVVVKLNVDSADAALVEDTVDEFLWAADHVTRHAFDGEYVTTSKTTLRDGIYSDVRDQTRLPATTSKPLATRPQTPLRA